MPNTERYNVRKYLSDLAHYIQPYRGEFFVGVFFRFTSDLSALYPSWATSQLISLLVHKGDLNSWNRVTWILTGWLILILYWAISHNLSKLFGYAIAEKASLAIYKDCLNHMFRLDFAWQEKENSGNKMKRIDKGGEGMNQTIRRVFDVLIEVGVNTIGISIIFLQQNVYLSLSLLAFMIIYYLIGTVLLKRALNQEQKVSKLEENLGGIAFESLNNIQTIKSLSISKGIMYVVKAQLKTLIVEIKKRIWYYRTRSAILLTYEVLFELAVIVYLCWGIWNGTFEVGVLILFIGLFHKVSQSIEELTDVTQELATSKIWISRAMYILRTEPEIEHPDKLKAQKTYPTDWQKITVSHLQFKYASGAALQDVSFEIQRGQKVGIVGMSGAGKSTLFKLFLDLYENLEGDIKLDDLSLKNMRRESYIDHVAVVLQDTELFDMTLQQNIEIAAPHGTPAKPELLKDVIHMAHLDDVVAQLPQGVDTMVGEKGIKLSGGQRQRLGIARALYRQPDILMMDEATSHLDAHSEKEIQKALEECMQNFTTIVIAHRLSTIRAMDKIIVLDKGVVAEEGSFGELIEKNGLFAQMWKEQKIVDEEEVVELVG